MRLALLALSALACVLSGTLAAQELPKSPNSLPAPGTPSEHAPYVNPIFSEEVVGDPFARPRYMAPAGGLSGQGGRGLGAFRDSMAYGFSGHRPELRSGGVSGLGGRGPRSTQDTEVYGIRGRRPQMLGSGVRGTGIDAPLVAADVGAFEFGPGEVLPAFAAVPLGSLTTPGPIEVAGELSPAEADRRWEEKAAKTPTSIRDRDPGAEHSKRRAYAGTKEEELKEKAAAERDRVRRERLAPKFSSPALATRDGALAAPKSTASERYSALKKEAEKARTEALSRP